MLKRAGDPELLTKIEQNEGDYEIETFSLSLASANGFTGIVIAGQTGASSRYV